MHRITGCGSMVSACVWDYAGCMELLRYFWDVASKMDPNARDLDEGRRFSICQRKVLDELFRKAGLLDVCCDSIETTIEFANFNEYWQPFLGSTGPAP